MSIPKVSINLVVLNGERYIHHCLDGILVQTYPHELIEFNILDNGSSDKTKDRIRTYNQQFIANNFEKFNLVESKLNLGMWPGQEELLKYSNGKYVLAMAVDVILDKDFIKNAVEVMERDSRLGAIEAKIYRYDLVNGEIKKTKVIDTCGFKIFRSRRLINIGHGEEDAGQYDNLGEIFGVEGAAPFYRREAMEDIRIDGDFCDHDYFWYGDDFDLAWRMNLMGWKQIFEPSVVAWHDRQTTKKTRKSFGDFLAIRRAIPLSKRQLEWKNVHFTNVKNDYIINVLKDLPYILTREIKMLLYLAIFEPRVLLAIPRFFKVAPKMIKKHSIIMRRARVLPEQIHKWFK